MIKNFWVAQGLKPAPARPATATATATRLALRTRAAAQQRLEHREQAEQAPPEHRDPQAPSPVPVGLWYDSLAPPPPLAPADQLRRRSSLGPQLIVALLLCFAGVLFALGGPLLWCHHDPSCTASHICP